MENIKVIHDDNIHNNEHIPTKEDMALEPECIQDANYANNFLNGDKENLFYENLNKKFMNYVDSVEEKKQKSKFKKTCIPLFRKNREKLASEYFEHKLKASDNAGIRFKKAITNDFYRTLQFNDEKLLCNFIDGKIRLNKFESKRFYSFRSVWKLFVLTVREKYENLYIKVHSLILKLIKNKDYYGYGDLEEMMNATGGLPYDTLLTNNGVDPYYINHIFDDNGNSVMDIRKELLKQKITSTLPKPEEFKIDDIFNMDDILKVNQNEKPYENEKDDAESAPTTEKVNEALEKAKKLIENDITNENK